MEELVKSMLQLVVTVQWFSNDLASSMVKLVLELLILVHPLGSSWFTNHL